MRWKAESLICFWLSYAVFLSGARKKQHKWFMTRSLDLLQPTSRWVQRTRNHRCPDRRHWSTLTAVWLIWLPVGWTSLGFRPVVSTCLSPWTYVYTGPRLSPWTYNLYTQVHVFLHVLIYIHTSPRLSPCTYNLYTQVHVFLHEPIIYIHRSTSFSMDL